MSKALWMVLSMPDDWTDPYIIDWLQEDSRRTRVRLQREHRERIVLGIASILCAVSGVLIWVCLIR